MTGSNNTPKGEDGVPKTMLRRGGGKEGKSRFEERVLKGIADDLAMVTVITSDNPEPQPLSYDFKMVILREAGSVLLDKRMPKDMLGKLAVMMEWEGVMKDCLGVLYHNQEHLEKIIGTQSSFLEKIFSLLPYYRAKHEIPKFANNFAEHEGGHDNPLSRARKHEMVMNTGVAINVSKMLGALSECHVALDSQGEPLPKKYLDAMRAQCLKMIDEGAFAGIEPYQVFEIVEDMALFLTRNFHDDPGMTVEEVSGYIHSHSEVFERAKTQCRKLPAQPHLDEVFGRSYKGRVFPLPIQAQRNKNAH